MDLDKLNFIRQDILSVPLEEKPKSEEFAGLYVDGTPDFTYDKAAWVIHGFRAYSQYEYPVFLFVSYSSNDNEIKKIISKFRNIYVTLISPLLSPILYNQWMFNNCFYLIPKKYQKILSFQDDGGLISTGWEEYVSKKPYSFLGAPWKSEIKALSPLFQFKSLKYANGGVAYRKLDDLIKCVDFVNENGGQHKVFNGVSINGKLALNNGWLAEDLMFNAVGHTFGFFEPVTEDECSKFSSEPIELSMYLDKNNPKRPLNFHKIDE